MASTRISTSLAHEPGFPILLTPDIDSEAASFFEFDPELDDMPKKPLDTTTSAAPRHPIPSMQDAFAESLVEATNGPVVQKPKLRDGDAKTRRQRLLDQDKSDGPPSAEWRFRPGQRNHELRKLMAQISFGVYLLLNGMANSNVSVVSILQGHINEVDEFLEASIEDVELATVDTTDRIDYLQLPMDNMTLFEQMLEDRTFRLQIVEGNVKIEHILSRTSTALVQTVEDVSEGLKCTREFTTYLASQQDGKWQQDRPDVIDIFEAMKGNTEGWHNAFLDLQAKATVLNELLLKLTKVISDIDRKAGEVSRRTRFSIQPFSSPVHSRQSSRGSSRTTPHASPPVSRRQNSPPPRLSLRLSSDLGGGLTDSAYFDLPTPKDVVPTIQFATILEDVDPNVDADIDPFADTGTNNDLDSEHEVEPESETEQDPKPKPESEAGTEAIPEPKSPESVIAGESPGKAEGSLYILQPRTYTPLPPAPEPSPRVLDHKPMKIPSPKLVEDRPVSIIPPRSMARPSSKSHEQLRSQVRNQASFDGSTLAVRISPKPPPLPIASPTSIPTGLLSPKSPGIEQSKNRTSLRQRVSLKTNPPDSILVPPLNAVELQRPIYSSPKYSGPDSAYGSDIERSNLHSVAEQQPPMLSPPPRLRPTLVPSPHSDQQYFRPVQASPHSPLQQRPHTAGTVRQQQASGYHTHQRNVPSRMGGMSTLSQVTTLRAADGGPTLKKKRSAFGWLKKAFSLDEEERAAFEQRRQEQSKNLYYDARSPKFLDGKRIR